MSDINYTLVLIEDRLSMWAWLDSITRIYREVNLHTIVVTAIKHVYQCLIVYVQLPCNQFTVRQHSETLPEQQEPRTMAELFGCRARVDARLCRKSPCSLDICTL